MSRSGLNDYDDDYDPLAIGRWQAAVNSSLRGKRGQAFLRELLAALDAMPDKRLIANAATKDGCMCTLAVVAAKRGHDLQELDSDMEMWEWDRIAAQLGISQAMAREVMWQNDEHTAEFEWIDRPEGPPTPEEWAEFERSHRYHLPDSIRRPVLDHGERRWKFMRNWVAKQIQAPAIQAPGAAQEAKP